MNFIICFPYFGTSVEFRSRLVLLLGTAIRSIYLIVLKKLSIQKFIMIHSRSSINKNMIRREMASEVFNLTQIKSQITNKLKQ